MTTQKKINKPSDDPVIAIRSLRMQTSLSHIDQYLNNNISDANSWLNVTDTALENMKTILTDVRSLCVKGATDTLKEDDRKTILNQLKSLSDQIYAEGNADFSGRTVFTGYLSLFDHGNDPVIRQQLCYNLKRFHRYAVGRFCLQVIRIK